MEKVTPVPRPFFPLDPRVPRRSFPAKPGPSPLATPADRIRIRNLLLRAAVGNTPRDLAERQDLRVSIAIRADLAPAGRSDALADSLDYSLLKKRILAMAGRGTFRTLERVAEEIAAICLDDPRAEQVEVEVERDLDMRSEGTAGAVIRRLKIEK